MIVPMFLEVSYGDFTANTNKEGQPFFLFRGKDSNGKSFMALHTFSLSEQCWVCQWLYTFHIYCAEAMCREVSCISQMVMTICTLHSLMQSLPHMAVASQHGLCLYHLVVQKLAKLPHANWDRKEVMEALHAYIQVLAL